MLTSLLLAYNDGYLHGVGGSATTAKPTQVQMVREHIFIAPASGRVSVSFTFKNHGDRTVTPMAFPEENYNAQKTDKGFRFFRSYVDSQRVRATRTMIDSSDEEVYKYWWVKNVPFSKGQTRRVRNEYKTYGGGTSLGTQMVTYTLATGATWKGKILRADAVVSLADFPTGTCIALEPPGYKIVGRRAVWAWTNFKPKPDHEIHIAWLPKKDEKEENALEDFKASHPKFFRMK